MEKIEIKYKLKPMNRAMLVSHAMNNIVSVFVGTFLISYIYSISNNFILDINLFYCFNYLAMTVFYYIVSAIIDKTNRVSLYRLAIIIRGLFIFIVIFLGKKLAGFVILAGLLHGTSEAFYWASYNLMKNELVSKHVVSKYSLWQQIDDKLVNIIIPLILGKIIDADSFRVAAYITFAMVIIQIVSTFIIKSTRPENSGFDMKGFFKRTSELGKHKSLVWYSIFVGGFYGFTNAVAPLNTILIMLSFGSNFSLGIITSIFALAYMAILLFYKRFTDFGERGWAYTFSAILPVVAAALLCFELNRTLVIIYMALYTVATITYSYGYDILRNILLKKLNMYDDIAEYQCAIEVSMGISRTMIFGVLAIAGLIAASLSAEALVIFAKVLTGVSILFLSAMQILCAICEKKFEKEGIIED